MKLYCFSSIGIIFPMIFAIIWDFKVFWRFSELQEKSQNYTLWRKYHLGYLKFRLILSILAKSRLISQILPVHCYLPLKKRKSPDNCKNHGKNDANWKKYNFIDFLIKIYFIDFLSKYNQECQEKHMSDPKMGSVKYLNF